MRDANYSWENDAFELYYQNRKENERKQARKLVALKLCGLLFIGLGIADALLLQDLTFPVAFAWPVGAYLVLVRKVVW